MRVPFVFFAFTLACFLGSTTARAQSSDEGEGEGGEGEGEGVAGEGEGEGEGGSACDPACTTVGSSDAVTFCDASAGGAPTTLACSDVEGADGCANIPGWGADCVLGNGAACDPDYAFGASRCDPGVVVDGQHLFCVNGKCTPAASKPAAPSPPVPTAGTHEVPTTATNTNPFSCLGCKNSSTSSAALFGAFLLSLRGLRRLLRRR